jgi:hypothetical membrane protein
MGNTVLRIKYLTRIAIIGPIFFTILVLILGSITPGYNHITQQISELGVRNASTAIYLNTIGTPVLGLSIISFSFACKLALEETRITRLGYQLFLLGGICMFIAGVFPCDPGCIPVTFTGTVHETVSNIGFFGIILAPFLFAAFFRKKSEWSYFWLPTMCVGLLTVIIVPIYLFEVFASSNGAIQRILLFVLLAWMVFVAYKIHQVKI